MNFWHVLEMEPTEDIKAIKKSYARLLKQFHPEDDPAGFQRLKEAYDLAVNHVKYVQKGIYDESAPIQVAYKQVENEKAPRNIVDSSLNEEESEGPLSIDKQVDNFINKAEELYVDFEKRIELENWRSLFRENVIWDIRANDLLNDRMLYFLEDHHYLTLEVWRFLSTGFDWQGREEKLRLYHNSEIIDYIFKIMKLDEYLDYSHLRGIDRARLDEYLLLRESAYWKSQRGDVYYASQDIEKAKKIFSEDPELFYIEIKAFMDNGSSKVAYELLTEAFKKFPSYHRFAYILAMLRFKEDKVKEALRILEKLESNLGGKSLSQESSILKIKCLESLFKYDLAREELLKLEKEPADKNELLQLKQEIYKNLRGKYLGRMVLLPWSASARRDYHRIKTEFEVMPDPQKLKNIGWQAVKVILYLLVVLIAIIVIFGAGIGGIAVFYFIIRGIRYLFRKRIKY